MLKVYTLINDFALSTTVECGGKPVNILFSGGCKAVRQNGEFCTTDAGLQAAIEGSGGFGKVYRLLKSYSGRCCVEYPEFVPAADGVAADGVLGSELSEKVCGTVNEAADWLAGLGCRKSDANTTAKAVAAARAAGYELKFKKGE